MHTIVYCLLPRVKENKALYLGKDLPASDQQHLLHPFQRNLEENLELEGWNVHILEDPRLLL